MFAVDTRQLILSTFVVYVSVALQDEAELKCTSKDRRNIFPRCMLFSVDKSLWCDQSNYTKVPGVDEINRYLPEGDCTAATSLYLNDSCITALSRDELCNFKKITTFCAERNKISQLVGATFEGNGELVTINLRMNYITGIHHTAFKGLLKLRVLNLERNSIANVNSAAFRDLKSLNKLILSDNELQVLHDGLLSPLKDLQELHITGNKLSHIEEHSFYGLTRLTHLHLDGNRLPSIRSSTFGSLRQLQVLTISHNRIQVWPEEYGVVFTNLHTLDLGHNMLTIFKTTHIANMSKLQNLSLENNSLKAVDEKLFISTPRLIYLNLGQNDIEDIPRDTFKDLCHLKHLVLKRNSMKTPRKEWFQRLVEGNDAGNLTDISGNKWECNCDVIKYREFLLQFGDENAVTKNPEWAAKLDIECIRPKHFENARLSQVYEYKFKQMDCEEATVTPRPTIAETPEGDQENCTEKEAFDKVPTLKPYRKPKLGHVKKANDETEEISSTQFWIIIAVVSAFTFVLLVIGAYLLHKRWIIRNTKRKSKARKSESAEPCLQREGAVPTNREDENVFA